MVGFYGFKFSYVNIESHGSVMGFVHQLKVSGERVGQETAAIVSCILAVRRPKTSDFSIGFLAEET